MMTKEKTVGEDIVSFQQCKRVRWFLYHGIIEIRSSSPWVFLRKSVLKICSKFTGEYPCQSVISINLQNNFIEITLRHGCPPVNLLHIFRTFFPESTTRGLLLRLAFIKENFTFSSYQCSSHFFLTQ